MKTRLAACALAIGAIAFAGGCASTKTATTAATTTPEQGTPGSSLAPEALRAPALWRLTELEGRAVIVPEGGKAPYLVFEKDAARVQGFAGCNSFFGGVSFGTAGRIRFAEMGSTMMACPGMEAEGAFLKALASVESYDTDGQVLKLHRAGMAPLAVFVASVSAE